MNGRRFAFGAVLVFMASSWAGCVSPHLPSLDSTIDAFEGSRIRSYHWPPLWVTDDQGAATSADTSDWPRMVEQVLPQEGSNPSLAINSKGHLFVSTFDRLQQSTDEGRTWTIVHNLTTPQFPSTPDRFSTQEATAWIDRGTDRLFVAHNKVGAVGNTKICNYLAYTDDEGTTWNHKNLAGLPVTCSDPSFTGSRLFTAPPGPDKGLLPQDAAYPYVLYYCDRGGQGNAFVYVPQFCASSQDSGATFSRLSLPLQDVDRSCRPVDWTQYRVAHPYPNGQYFSAGTESTGRPASYADGTLVVPLNMVVTGPGGGACPLAVALSKDSGASWSFRIMPAAPNAYSIEPETQIAITPDGIAYYAYRSNDTFVYLVRSRDRFQTWEGPFRVAPQAFVYNRMVSIVAGSNGRVALAYLATQTPQDTESYWLNPSTAWHLQVSISLNADAEHPRFVTQQVTPGEDPVQIGCIQGGEPNPASSEVGCQNLLNTLNIALDPQGRVFAAFTDGCGPRNNCTKDLNSGFQARDREVAIAAEDGGLSLLEGKAVLPPLGLKFGDAIPSQKKPA